jgi:WD40 repeat protein
MKRLSFLYIFLIVLVSILSNTTFSYASEPPKEPILRIETGMHTVTIARIGIDAENRYLVTVSNDKTVRVWELYTGRLIRTIRPPIGEGNEGKIYAVAVSPDGKTIACGGWTGQEWDDMFASIYLFDLQSGRFIKRITGVSASILHLAYSKDGRFLVAALWGQYGIRVFRTYDYSLVAEDKNYGSDSYGANFDINGRLATTSYDGFVRLYDENFRLIAKKKTPGGNMPYGISFSPDGSRIAVGFDDAPKVDVLSGYDLSYLYSPDTSDIQKKSLGFGISWSTDGRFLYAAGMHSIKTNEGWKRIIRKWSDGGRGRYVDLPAADNTVLHILSLKDGGIVFGAAGPAFGVFDAANRNIVFKGGSVADFREGYETFRVSYDGSTIQFGYKVWGESTARFSVLNRFLDTALMTASSEILSAPVTYAEGLNITDWKHAYNPKLNGRDLKIKQYETSRSVAISPDRRHILLGAEWYLRLFDTYGNEKWKVAVPGIAWVVNISGNGRLAIAALGDGTIRWYRIEDGKELLALFPHNDRKRWVMWTPSGYYDASPGADEIIGWHRNTAKKRQRISFPYPSSGRHITGLM